MQGSVECIVSKDLGFGAYCQINISRSNSNQGANLHMSFQRKHFLISRPPGKEKQEIRQAMTPVQCNYAMDISVLHSMSMQLQAIAAVRIGLDFCIINTGHGSGQQEWQGRHTATHTSSFCQ